MAAAATKVNCNGTELSQNALQILQSQLDSLVYKKRPSHNKTQCVDMKMKKEIGV